MYIQPNNQALLRMRTSINNVEVDKIIAAVNEVNGLRLTSAKRLEQRNAIKESQGQLQSVGDVSPSNEPIEVVTL
jgi:hypothetical protein